jgi:GNAT superfamily N-acetyltransferase
VQRPVGLALYGGLVPVELREYARLHVEGHFLGCEKHPEAAGTQGPLDRLARVVRIPTLTYDYYVLLAVVAWPAAHGRGVGAKLIAAGSHAVAWRVAFGAETVGFLKLAIFGLRAIEHPARAVALTTVMIAVQASCPSLRTALTQSRRSEGRNPYRRLEVI